LQAISKFNVEEFIYSLPRSLPNTQQENGEEWVGTAFTELKKLEAIPEESLANSPTILESIFAESNRAEELYHKEAKQRYSDHHLRMSHTIRNIEELEQLKEQVKQIIKKNELAPDLERLDSSELVIDLEEKDRLVEEGEKYFHMKNSAIIQDFIGR
jgi:hypothetical protein